MSDVIEVRWLLLLKVLRNFIKFTISAGNFTLLLAFILGVLRFRASKMKLVNLLISLSTAFLDG